MAVIVSCSLISRAVSEPVQKYAGPSPHPICKHLGTTSLVVPEGLILGRT